MAKKKQLSLREFIEEGVEEMGLHDFKGQFGCSEANIYQWKRGHCLPSVDQLHLIVKLSKGRVSYARMIEDYLEVNSKNRKEAR